MRIRDMVIAVAVVAITASGARAAQWDSASRAKVVYDKAMASASGSDKVTGELFCWTAAFYGHYLLQGYHAYKDEIWLDYTQKYLDQLESRMATGPDGYRGFIGPYIYDKNYWADVHVGDGVLCEMMAEFAEIVLTDPQLKQKYGQRGEFYLNLVKRNFVEKWEARGTWYEDGLIAGYISWDHYGKPGEFTGWKKYSQDSLAGTKLALPINKSLHLAGICLRIYRMTGEQSYLKKAEKVFNFHRLRMQNYDGCMVWNYWEPLAPSDVNFDEKKPRHWMATHPYRNYQSGEVATAVDGYQMGLTYTAADMRKIINTNLKIMWNGDMENPKYANADVTLPGYERAPDSAHYPTRAGTLWSSLAALDPTVRKLYAKSLEKIDFSDSDVFDDIRRAYFENYICAQPASLKRKYAPDAKVAQLPDSSSAGQTVACALPMEFAAGQSTILLTKVQVDGQLKIEVRDAGGQKVLATLFDESVPGGSDGMVGITMIKWDGKIDGAITPGKYIVSWLYRGGRRDYPVTITAEE